MQIEFDRRGGFAGISLHASIDTGRLPPQESASLIELVRRSGFFDLPERILPTGPEAGPQPDRFHYHLSIRDDTRLHTVDLPDSAVPPSLQPLLNALTRLARSQPRT